MIAGFPTERGWPGARREMEMAVQAQRRYSPEEYLEFERKSEYKSEYLDGLMYAMAGESPDHSTICFNLTGVTYGQLRDRNCRGFSPRAFSSPW